MVWGEKFVCLKKENKPERIKHFGWILGVPQFWDHYSISFTLLPARIKHPTVIRWLESNSRKWRLQQRWKVLGRYDPTSGSAGIWKIPGILWRVWMVLSVPKSPKSSEEPELQVFGRFRWCDANLLDQKFSSPCFQKCMSSHETRHMSYCKRLPTRNGCHKLQQLLHNCKWLWSNDLG